MADFPYVELDRRFIDIGSADPEDDTQSALLLAVDGKKVGLKWEELFTFDAAIILGSAGSGKTTEILHQAQKLRSSGTPAFVLRLEALCREPIHRSFAPMDTAGSASFKAWYKSSGRAVAFLDALDEARLPLARNSSALLDALAHLSEGIGKRSKNLNIVITTRGSEWQGASDLSLVKSSLLRMRASVEDEKIPSLKLGVFRLADLNRSDISAIAESRNVHGEKFLSEVNRSLSANLMRQPLEVHFLLDIWIEKTEEGKVPGEIFSSRLNVFEKIVSSRLRAMPGEERRSNLDPLLAKRACEKLAACVILSSTRDLSANGEIDNTIPAIDALSTDVEDWTEAEVRQLLSSALFHPSVAGKIRFSHNELRDFLAAGFFCRGIQDNAGSLHVLNPLVATGLETIEFPKPTQHTVGWLATLNPIVRGFVIKHNPALLIETGDPTLLSNDEKERALEKHIERYENRKYRGEWFYHDDIKKFASPELSPVVKKLIDKTTSPEALEFLLEIARFGEMTDLADDIASISIDQNQALRVRAGAAFALAAFNDQTHTEQVGVSTLISAAPAGKKIDGAPSWNLYLLASLSYAYPRGLTLIDAIAIIARLQREARNYSSSSGDVLDDFAASLKSEECGRWLRIFLRFSAGKRSASRYMLPVAVDKYQLLSPAIGRLVLRLILEGNEREYKDAILDALEYLFQVNDEISMSRRHTPFEEIAVAIKPLHELKQALIWRRDKLFEPKDERRVHYGVIHPLGFGHDHNSRSIFVIRDIQILCEKMQMSANAREKYASYEYAKDVLIKLDSIPEKILGRKYIAKAARKSGDPYLKKQEATSYLAIFPRFMPILRRDVRYNLKFRISKMGRDLKNYYWRARNFLSFFGKRKEITSSRAVNLLVWGAKHSLNDPGIETVEKIRQEYGAFVARWFELGFSSFWRRYDIRRSEWHTYTAIVGLAGLGIDFERNREPNSSEERLRAFKFAFSNLNSLPDWAIPLAEKYSEEFRQVCQPLLLDEFASPPPKEIITPSDCFGHVAYSSVAVRSTVAPFLFNELQTRLPLNFADFEIGIHIISRSRTTDGNLVATFLRSGFESAIFKFDLKAAWVWLDALFSVNSQMAWESLIAFIGQSWSGAAANIFVDFMGQDRRYISREEDLSLERNSLRDNSEVLARLIRASYLAWPPDRDPVHEDVYSPGLEDRATDRRRNYVGMLQRLTSVDALTALDNLIEDAALSEHRDSLLYVRDQLVHNSVRRRELNVEQIIEFLNTFSKEPTSIEEFRELATRHIEALLNKLHVSDDDESYMYRSGRAKEDDLRNWLAARLRESGNRFYSVIREQEVASEKRPDLRLIARNKSLGNISVEIKLADESHWTGDNLVNCVETQLVNQYMNDYESHSGIYLIVNAARPRTTEKRSDGSIKRAAFSKTVNGVAGVSFEGLIAAILERSTTVNAALGGAKLVSVISADFSEKVGS